MSGVNEKVNVQTSAFPTLQRLLGTARDLRSKLVIRVDRDRELSLALGLLRV